MNCTELQLHRVEQSKHRHKAIHIHIPSRISNNTQMRSIPNDNKWTFLCSATSYPCTDSLAALLKQLQQQTQSSLNTTREIPQQTRQVTLQNQATGKPITQEPCQSDSSATFPRLQGGYIRTDDRQCSQCSRPWDKVKANTYSTVIIQHLIHPLRDIGSP